jgi:hypothetical protein
MNTYKWTIISLSTLPSPPAPIDKCAVFAEYTVIATNKDNPLVTALINNSVQFDMPTKTDNLIPFKNLTEEQVLSWIQAEPNLVDSIQANLDGQIDFVLNPPISAIETPLPWASK